MYVTVHQETARTHADRQAAVGLWPKVDLFRRLHAVTTAVRQPYI